MLCHANCYWVVVVLAVWHVLVYGRRFLAPGFGIAHARNRLVRRAA